MRLNGARSVDNMQRRTKAEPPELEMIQVEQLKEAQWNCHIFCLA